MRTTMHIKKDGTVIPIRNLTTLHLRCIIHNQYVKAHNRTDNTLSVEELLKSWNHKAYTSELFRRIQTCCPACGAEGSLTHLHTPVKQQTRCSRCPFILTSDTIHHTTLLEKLAL